jgi:hypothetical protein
VEHMWNTDPTTTRIRALLELRSGRRLLDRSGTILEMLATKHTRKASVGCLHIPASLDHAARGRSG